MQRDSVTRTFTWVFAAELARPTVERRLPLLGPVIRRSNQRHDARPVWRTIAYSAAVGAAGEAWLARTEHEGQKFEADLPDGA